MYIPQANNYGPQANSGCRIRREFAVDISVDPGAGVPPYAQIRAQITERVANGDLEAGTRLPTVRALADELGLATNTVARSYRELETAGIVVTRGRHGTVVSDSAPGMVRRARASLRRAAEKYVTATDQLGVDAADAINAVRRVIELRTATG